MPQVGNRLFYQSCTRSMRRAKVSRGASVLRLPLHYLKEISLLSYSVRRKWTWNAAQPCNYVSSSFICAAVNLMARVIIRVSLHNGTKLVIMKGHNYLFNYNCMSRRPICQESIMCLICESKCWDPTRVWLTVLCPSYPSCKGEQNSAHKRRETIGGGWSNSILSFSSRTSNSCLHVRARCVTTWFLSIWREN